MRRLLPWGLAAAVLAACQVSPPAAPPSPPATQPPVQVVPDSPPDPRVVLAPILFLTGPDTMTAGQTATLQGRAMLPAGSTVTSLDVQSLEPSPAPTSSSPFGGGFGRTSTYAYMLKAEAQVPDPSAAEVPVDFEFPFTPPSAGTYHLDLQPRRYSVMVSSSRSTSGGWPRPSGPSPAPSPVPELWGLLKPATLPADEALLGNPSLVTRQLTSVQMPSSARVGQRVQMIARFWTNGLGKTAIDAYVDGQQIRVSGLSMPDTRAVMGPIPQQVEVPFSVLLTERGHFSVVSGVGEGSYGAITVN